MKKLAEKSTAPCSTSSSANPSIIPSPVSVGLPSPSPPVTPDHPDLGLIWHLCHLCNAITSSINAYLSLEALARHALRTPIDNNIQNSAIAYQPIMRSQSLMLTDLCRNLEATRAALLQSALHIVCLQDSAYRSLIDAANYIPTVVALIPQMVSPFLDAQMLDEACMPGKHVVDGLRVACDYLTELSQARTMQGIQGWKDCWHVVNLRCGYVFPQY